MQLPKRGHGLGCHKHGYVYKYIEEEYISLGCIKTKGAI